MLNMDLLNSISKFITNEEASITDLVKNPIVIRNDNKILMTGFFSLFIFISIFNAFNARTTKLNILDDIFNNYPNLQLILEDNCEMILGKTECKICNCVPQQHGRANHPG